MNPIELAKTLLKKFEPLSMSAVGDIVYYLQAQDDLVFFHGTRLEMKLLVSRNWAACIQPQNVEIRFYGGPPTQGRWVTASVYSFLLDKVACIIVNNGSDAARRALKYGRN